MLCLCNLNICSGLCLMLQQDFWLIGNCCALSLYNMHHIVEICTPVMFLYIIPPVLTPALRAMLIQANSRSVQGLLHYIQFSTYGLFHLHFSTTEPAKPILMTLNPHRRDCLQQIIYCSSRGWTYQGRCGPQIERGFLYLLLQALEDNGCPVMPCAAENTVSEQGFPASRPVKHRSYSYPQ